MLKNLPALKSAYQTASELHRRIVESGSIVSGSDEKIHDLSKDVEVARKHLEIVTGDHLVGVASAADRASAQNKLDAGIAARDGAISDLSVLRSAIHRLSVNSNDAKADLGSCTNAALLEITQSHETSIKENEKLHQMLLDIHSAGILAEHVLAGGAAGFAAIDVTYSGWHDVVTRTFMGAFPEPSLDELEAALVAFKEKYGFSSLGK